MRPDRGFLKISSYAAVIRTLQKYGAGYTANLPCFSLQSTTSEEVAAFLHASLGLLPDDVAAAYRTRCLVATSADSARALARAPAPLILVLTDPDPGLARTLVDQGHYVLQAYDERQRSPGGIRTLARPTREDIAAALIKIGISRPRAESLARDCARNLSVLRRLIPSAPDRPPRWAQAAPDPALLAAMMVGGWDENVEADRARLAEMADQPYERVVAALASYVGNFDSPLRKVGSGWRMASPWDAWFLLAPYLTSAHLTRYETAAHAVLGSADPRFEMGATERWMAAFRGVRPEYSGMLRQGIGQVLILLALRGEVVRNVVDARRRADVIVGKLLQDADPQRWWSLSRDFRLLAEASPTAFMTAIEDSLDRSEPPIRSLFGADNAGLFGAEYLSGLLWALESLAWSPELMPRVSHVLARLDAIDNTPGRYAGRPANSLREIHILWQPQTNASLDQRLRSLDFVRQQESDAAWKLMLGILPGQQDTSTPSPTPRWRDFTVDQVEVVTSGLLARGAAAISERLLADAGSNVVRWSQLLDRFSDLAPGPEAGLAALVKVEMRIADSGDRAVLWASMRRVLHRHRQFPDARWSMSGEALDRLEIIYKKLAPPDPIERVAWLFEREVALPNPSGPGWEAAKRDIDATRQAAAQMLFNEGGEASILTLARRSGAAGFIGKALYDGGLSIPDLDSLLHSALLCADAHERDLARGLISAIFYDQKEPWAATLLAKARREAWGDTALLTILLALPCQRSTWDQAAQAGADVEDAYWRLAPHFWTSDSSEDTCFAVRKLMKVGRAYHAVILAKSGNSAVLTSELLIEMLREAARQNGEIDGDAMDEAMFQCSVAEILKLLDERNDVDMDTLIELEWVYFPLLQNSERPATVLLKALSEQPELFITMVCAAFKPSDESGLPEIPADNPEHAHAVASQAYQLLEVWNVLPGTRDNGTIDRDFLENWIKNARARARSVGRADIADSRIGNVLSASPIGEDGNWPAEAVRGVIDLFRSMPMINGFTIGKLSRRGVTSRDSRDGGRLERQEATKYRQWAKATIYGHPHTARALDTLADDFEGVARNYDERAERRDWEH